MGRHDLRRGARSGLSSPIAAMTSQPQHSPVDAFVDALHDNGCQLATVLAHMATFRGGGRSAAGAPPPEDTLRRLLGDVLTPALSRLSEREVHTAARVV